MDKGDFIGKDALQTRQDAGPQHRLVTLQVDTTSAPAHPGASLMLGDKVVGTVTSGGWGHRTEMNLAYAFVTPDHAEVGSRCEIDILGTRIAATIIPTGPYGPT
jgi:dimethylglycine dehydrogenase